MTQRGPLVWQGCLSAKSHSRHSPWSWSVPASFQQCHTLTEMAVKLSPCTFWWMISHNTPPGKRAVCWDLNLMIWCLVTAAADTRNSKYLLALGIEKSFFFFKSINKAMSPGYTCICTGHSFSLCAFSINKSIPVQQFITFYFLSLSEVSTEGAPVST